METITHLFLVDDQPGVTDALRWLLGTVGIASTAFNEADAFLAHFGKYADPSVVVLDLRMPKLTGVEVLERILGVRPDTPLIMLTGHGDVPSAVRAMKLGAFDYLMKPFNPQGFLEAIGGARRQAERAHRLSCRKRQIQEALANLSPRETEIFDGVIGGMSSKEIGRTLAISPKTVDVHRASIMKKIGVASARELQRRFHPFTDEAGDVRPSPK